ncbi:FecR family protein [Filimonas lacunae]|nr:FecR domain-containing protein [Filimonas lacunae]
MTQNRLSDLIAKKKSAELSPSELIELNVLLKEEEAARRALAKADAIWNQPVENAAASPVYVQDRWNALQAKIAAGAAVDALPVARKSILKILLPYAAAACLATIVAAGIVMWKLSRPHGMAKQNIISTKNGSRSKVQLPDGTVVWLNGGSQLAYSDSFGQELREVKLIGEAFFDVSKDAEHPFIIHANEINIKVLGTAFNVRAYPDDKRTEASLIHGLIEVSFNNRPSDRMLLKPNEKISVMNGEIQKFDMSDKAIVETTHKPTRNAEEPLISFSKIGNVSPSDSTIPETAWIKNKLIFRNKSFEELAKDMERWYNVSFECSDSALLQKHFTGSFYHESISEALEILRLSYPFHYKIDKNKNIVVIQ